MANVYLVAYGTDGSVVEKTVDASDMEIVRDRLTAMGYQVNAWGEQLEEAPDEDEAESYRESAVGPVLFALAVWIPLLGLLCWACMGLVG